MQFGIGKSNNFFDKQFFLTFFFKHKQPPRYFYSDCESNPANFLPYPFWCGQYAFTLQILG